MPPLPPSDLAGPPPAGTPVPRAIATLAEHHPVELVWQNEACGITARIDRPTGAVFAKWNPSGSGESLAAEAERMRWLAQTGSVPVPEVVDLLVNAAGETLVTAAINGGSIVSSVGRRDPESAAAALGEGLRRLHAVPIASCPFPAPGWTASTTTAAATTASATTTSATRTATATATATATGDSPTASNATTDQSDLVVCHGDPCAPNTLISGGAFAGLVDLGRVGVGDRWSDLAIASWSLDWNGLGDGEPVFWRAYGVQPDAVRVERWRAIWNGPDGALG